MKHLSRKLVASLVVGFFAGAPLAMANSCPTLTGAYACPAYGPQPAYTLIVKQKDNTEDQTLYKHYYSFFGEWLPTLISDAGAYNPGGWIGKCTSYLGNPSFVYYPAAGDPVTQGTYNFINADGDYQADYNGSPALICTKI